MLQFIPFDDRWFDTGELPPGPLVPYHVGVPCAHARESGTDHCVAAGTSMKAATSPSCTPRRLAAPALSSST